MGGKRTTDNAKQRKHGEIRCKEAIEMAEKKDIPFTNSPRVLANLAHIKAQKERRLNKLGEWFYSKDPDKLYVEVTDLRAVMK